MKNFSGMVNKTGFEIESCARCGGSGRYSFNLMHGDTCYGCGGTGKVYTARGKKARAWLIERQQMPVADLKVGYQVWCSPNMGAERWYFVQQIGEGFFKCGGCAFYGHSVVRAIRDAAQSREDIAAALAYQETI